MAARAALNESEEDSYEIEEKICSTFIDGSTWDVYERLRSGGRGKRRGKS